MAPEEQHALEQAPAAPVEPKPASGGRKRQRKAATVAPGEAAALDALEELVLEESTDVEDNQAPWADA